MQIGRTARTISISVQIASRGRKMNNAKGLRHDFYGEKSCLLLMAIAALLPLYQQDTVGAAEADVPPPTSTGAPASAEDENQLAAIIITANRRGEDLQKVPIAVTALTAESAAQMGITDPQSLAGSVPGLQFNREANASIPFIRGVGTLVGESGDEPSVALYVDDVYIPAGSASLANFNSIDRLEVEKGPQGTLFGRNATGGVVQVFTKNPSAEPELDNQLGYANYNTPSGSIYATGPLAQNLTANIALYGSDQYSGWGTNIAIHRQAFKQYDFGGRVKLLWTPTSHTTALLTFDYDTTSTPEGIGFRPAAGTLSAIGTPPPTGFYDLNSSVDTYAINRQEGVSAKVTEDMDWAKFVSISAYRNTKAFEAFSDFATPVSFIDVGITNPEKTFTQELQLLSPDNARLNWIVGLYYFDDSAGYDPLHFAGPAFAPFPYINTYGLEFTHSYSGFAQATANVLPDTHLTAGLRYTSDLRTLEASTVFDGAPPISAPNSPQSKTFAKPTGRLSLDHEFTDDIMAYVAFNRGFKSGLFNPVVGPGAPIGAPVAPETLNSYSVGAKAEFLDKRLRTNIEGFYYKYKNVQVDEVFGDVTSITNAASATIKGVDLDITARPVENLTVTGSLEILDSHYDAFPDGQFLVYQASGGNCTFSATNDCGGAVFPPHYNPITRTWDLGGNHTVQSPPVALSLAGNYVVPTNVGPVSISVSWAHTASFYWDADNGAGQVAPSSSLNDQQKTTDIFNASLSWTDISKRWSVRFWGKNLSGVRYASYVEETAGITEYSPAPPRTYGVIFGMHLL